jgi:hypothetical protein
MPVFKSNLDIQQNQLQNAVLHRCPDLPVNPVEGQLYYNEGKHLAYLWDGQYWVPWGYSSGGGGGSGEVRQFVTTILNPNLRSGAIIVRLYEDLVAVRVDAHFSTVNTVYFNIDYRTNVNQSGTYITDRAMTASYDSNEYTTIDHAWLKKDDWLYLSIASGSGDTGTVVEGDPAGTAGETGTGTGTEPPAGDGEVLGVLTVILTCVTY